MIRIGLCSKDNNPCEKKDTCLRYAQEYGEPMNMLAICGSENNYKYHWHTETAIQTTEENSSNSQNTNEEKKDSK